MNWLYYHHHYAIIQTYWSMQRWMAGYQFSARPNYHQCRVTSVRSEDFIELLAATTSALGRNSDCCNDVGLLVCFVSWELGKQTSPVLKMAIYNERTNERTVWNLNSRTLNNANRWPGYFFRAYDSFLIRHTVKRFISSVDIMWLTRQKK